MNSKLLPLALILFLTDGCTVSQNMRQRAADLDKQVTSFRDEQLARVDKLNRDYGEQSNQLFAQLEALGDSQLSFDRTHDATAVADGLATNVDAMSLPGAFADRLEAAVRSQLKRLDDVDTEIQKARDQYATHYAELKFSVRKLNDLHDQLKILAAADNKKDLVSIMIKDVEAAYNGIKAAQKQAAAAKQSASNQIKSG
jgi:hypothetical protein